jgi:hypothetical protein
MFPQAQDWGFNMELCRHVKKKPMCHTESAFEKQAQTKKEPPPQSILWQPQKTFHHIKRKKPKQLFLRKRYLSKAPK